MEMLEFKEYDNEAYYTKKIKMSDNVQVDSFITIVKSFENEQVKMSYCHCETYDNDGYPVVRRYYVADDIVQIKDGLSPYVSFTVDFCQRETSDYCFSLLACVNSDVVSYIVDKKKLTTDMSKSSLRR